MCLSCNSQANNPDENVKKSTLQLCAYRDMCLPGTQLSYSCCRAGLLDFVGMEDEDVLGYLCGQGLWLQSLIPLPS